MAGIYVHIPFCRSRCVYCDFYSTTSMGRRQRYVDALCRELELRSSYINERVRTIYIGGGTPSQLTSEQLIQLFDALGKAEEVTLECNPDDVTPAFAELLSRLGVNRVSMGAQTFNDARLCWLHRRHTSQQVSEAVSRLRQAGIQNISVDLMYGFPGETLADWEHDIQAVLSLNVEHLSAYCLSIEEGTPLHRMNIKGPDEETERKMYYTLVDRLETAGFEHYEISNFARPGFRSRHNSGYWNYTPYIGLGAAAHSFDGHTRSWNISDIYRYIEGIERGERLFESELIEGDTAYNDLLTTALRTCDGLDLSRLSPFHRDYCLKAAKRYIDAGLLTIKDEHLALTRNALFVSDMVISNLMLV